MNREQRLRFIDDELRGLWPEWGPSEAEIRLWMGILGPYDYGDARAALQQCFCGQAGNYRRPRPAAFLAKAKALTWHSDRPGPEAPRELTTAVFIDCLEPPQHNLALAGARKGVFVRPLSKQNDLDYVRACAESMRKRFEQLYGGRWATVVTKPPADDGLLGEPARDEAYEAILNGPESPGKRWLRSLLAGRAATQSDVVPRAEPTDPLPLAEALTTTGLLAQAVATERRKPVNWLPS